MKLQQFIRAALVAASLCVTAQAQSARAATTIVTNVNDSGAGSLRQAILTANGTVNVPDVINFNIPGTGPFTITPVTPLPMLSDPVVIDGYTEPGASANTLT